METILVDNKNIQDVFDQMLSAPFQHRTTRVLCLSARSGKGKSTLVSYFSERCEELSVLPIRLDFDAFHITDELELIDIIINQITTLSNISSAFSKYEESIKSLALSSVGDTVIQNVNLRQTQIGTIHIQKGGEGANAQLILIEKAFLHDLRDAARTVGRIVILLDAFEQAATNIQEWVQKKLILSRVFGPEILIVVAGQEELRFSRTNQSTYGIRAFHLPDEYSFEDWLEYGRQLKINDTNIIKNCFNCWNGDPFYMCVSLKPFANKGDI